MGLRLRDIVTACRHELLLRQLADASCHDAAPGLNAAESIRDFFLLNRRNDGPVPNSGRTGVGTVLDGDR